MPSATPAISLDGHCVYAVGPPFVCSSCIYTTDPISVGAQASPVAIQNHGAINFDYGGSPLPAGATIISASLALRCTAINQSRGYNPTKQVNVGAGAVDWGATLECGDSIFAGGSSAGSFTVTATGAVTHNFSSVVMLPTSGKISVTLTPNWSPTGTQSSILSFASQENGTSSYHPVLTVTYTLPGSEMVHQLTLVGVGT